LSDSGAHLSSLGHEEQRDRLGASALLQEACTMPSPRDTMRLPEPLPTHVHASWETTRTPLVTRIREALSASLADKMPTGLPLCADSTDPLTALHTHVTDGTARVQGMEDILTAWSQRAARNADRRPDTAPTPTDRPRASRAHARPRSTHTDATPATGSPGYTPAWRAGRCPAGGIGPRDADGLARSPEPHAGRKEDYDDTHVWRRGPTGRVPCL
jgi:hypothetical protein